MEVILRVVDLPPVEVGEKVAMTVQFPLGRIVGVRLGQGFEPDRVVAALQRRREE